MTTTDPLGPPGTDLRRWRTALVYGLGISGRAAVRLLARRGVRVEGVDRQQPVDLSRELPELVAFHREDRLASVPPEVDVLVLSPGVPPDRPLVEDARRREVPVVAEVEVGWQHLRERVAGTVVAITGSNGKSTTTALTGALLEAADHRVRVCGNIGTAFSEAVLEEEDRWGDRSDDRGRDDASGCLFVVELSSFQVEGLHTFHPRAAAYLNLSPDHLDRYRGVDEYAAAKARLPALLGRRDTAVLNLDDERTATAQTAARKRFFTRLRRPGAGLDDGCWLDGGRVMELDPPGVETLLFERSDLRLAGEHNLENAMAAALLARSLGASSAAIRSGLASFAGLPHRMEKVGELPLRSGGAVGDVVGVATFWNDSKGTNPAATLRSLEGFTDGSVHLILGGRAKGTDFRVLAPLVRRKVRRLYLVGEAAEEIERALAEIPVPIHRCDTLERAVAEGWSQILRERRPAVSLLLSPACASFDQFRSFAHRGDEFRALVRELQARSDPGGNPGPPHTVDPTTEEACDGDQAGL